MPKDNIPEIRVRGFSDEWKQRKLNELIMYQSSNLTASDASDIGKYDLYDANTIIGKTNIEPIRSEYITVIKDGAGVGRIRVLPPNTMFIGTMGGLQATKSDLSYIYTLLSRFELGKECSGSTIPHIYFKDYGNNEYFVPTIEEQQTIGSYFAKIDNLITLHQRKYDALVSVKKAMLEKMFPKAGETVPEIRFAGFTDPWEQRKLSELATMHARIGWQNLRTSEFLDAGDYMLITGTDFEDGKVNYSTCHYVEKERYDQDKNIQIKNGNILITKDGTLGKVAYVEGLCLPATLNAGVFNVEIKDENETDSKYLFQFLKAPFLMDYVSKKATGGTIKHLNQNILVDFPIATPSKAEQVRIGEYFSNLDNLITLHQRKCEVLKNLKFALLSKMFL